MAERCRCCKEFFARYRCNAAMGECDCPKCQGYCECWVAEETEREREAAAGCCAGYADRYYGA